MIDAFPASFCSQNYLPAIGGNLHTTFSQYNSFQVFAVYPTAGSLLLEGFFSIAEPEYVMLLKTDSTRRDLVTVLLFDSEALVSYGSTCAMPLSDYILGQNLTDPIIPPPQDR